MNKFVLIFLLVASASATSFAQKELYQAKIKKEAIPAVILTSIQEDFPDATAFEYTAIPVTIMEEGVYVQSTPDFEAADYDTYVVALQTKGENFTATYDRNGNLISFTKVLRNTALPHNIQLSIGRHFPGWSVANDKMVMTSIKGRKQHTHYKVKLDKGNEHHTVIFDANGNLTHGAEKAKKHRLLSFKKAKMDQGDEGDGNAGH